MRFPPFVAILAALAGTTAASIQAQAAQPSTTTATPEAQSMTWLTGKTIKWTFVDGPTAGATFEHSFNDDGSVTWRALDGQWKGATAREKSYVAVKVNEKTWVISYLAASGHTLTVVLNFDDNRVVGLASNDKSLSSLNGTFELLK